MRKNNKKSLALTTQTVRNLDKVELTEIAGAATSTCPPTAYCTNRQHTCVPW